MPELPEVETARRGIAPYIEGQSLRRLVVRNRRLRWPVPTGLEAKLRGREVKRVDRRGKYLLLRLAQDTLMIHLGMSGALRILAPGVPAQKHDHWDLQFGNGCVLRFNDPRRFGSLHLTADPLSHPLLAALGPEPLHRDFSGAYLYRQSRGRRVLVKDFLMNARVVAGVGNIYACEALFQAGIHPRRAAGRISLKRYQRLVNAVKAVLNSAIEQGGTTLRDFLKADGRPGYFRVRLQVYGRDGQHCHRCGSLIRRSPHGQRGTWYCPGCQH